MTDREIRKLGRRDLLQMLVEQGRELQELKEKYTAAQRELEDRTIRLDRAGSIAEAALQLNGVFEAAQAACRQYTDSIALLSEQEGCYICPEADTGDKARQLLAETEERCDAMIRQTEEACEAMRNKAKAESQQYWDQVFQKLQAASRQCAQQNGVAGIPGRGSDL